MEISLQSILMSGNSNQANQWMLKIELSKIAFTMVFWSARLDSYAREWKQYTMVRRVILGSDKEKKRIYER